MESIFQNGNEYLLALAMARNINKRILAQEFLRTVRYMRAAANNYDLRIFRL